MRRVEGDGGSEGRAQTEERIRIVQVDMRAARDAAAKLWEAVVELDTVISECNPDRIGEAVERLREARRHADATLRDTQEAADRALDQLSEPPPATAAR